MSERTPYSNITMVTGFFKPKRTDDLSDESKAYIGKKLDFLPGWTIDEDDGRPAYTGQRIMQVFEWVDGNRVHAKMGWVPEEDVEITGGLVDDIIGKVLPEIESEPNAILPKL